MTCLTDELTHDRKPDTRASTWSRVAKQLKRPIEVARSTIELTDTVTGLANLALDHRASQGIPTITKGARVRVECMFVVADSFGVSGDPERLVAHLEQIVLRLRPVLCLCVVIREHPVVLLTLLADEQFGGGGDPCVKVTSTANERARVHRLLD